MIRPSTRAVRLDDVPDPGPQSAGADIETYVRQFEAAWSASANADDPMPAGWFEAVTMLHSRGFPLRELLGYVKTVCSPTWDDRWCCTDCAFHRVVGLCDEDVVLALFSDTPNGEEDRD